MTAHILADLFSSIIFFFQIKRYLKGETIDKISIAFFIRIYKYIILINTYFCVTATEPDDGSFYEYYLIIEFLLQIICIFSKYFTKNEWIIWVFMSEEKMIEYQEKLLK